METGNEGDFSLQGNSAYMNGLIFQVTDDRSLCHRKSSLSSTVCPLQAIIFLLNYKDEQAKNKNFSPARLRHGAPLLLFVCRRPGNIRWEKNRFRFVLPVPENKGENADKKTIGKYDDGIVSDVKGLFTKKNCSTSNVRSAADDFIVNIIEMCRNIQIYVIH